MEVALIIEVLEIRNFKSIKHLKLACKRVNIFIGKPNTGKSNILEALGLFSLPHTGRLRDFVRFDDMSDLFYDHDLGEVIELLIKVSEYSLRVELWDYLGDKDIKFARPKRLEIR
ncbi:MAG TPA: DUF2813 domain-containing protein, partial [Chloroflexi bacterium]|nr:DUF2813 domain-containing protein [Chloroflexota bacterium]